MAYHALSAAGLAGMLVLIAPDAQARTVTITFDGGCEALAASVWTERQLDGREGPISFTDPNLAVYDHCSDTVLLGDDGWSGDSSLECATGEPFDVLSLGIGGDHHVVRILDSMDMDAGEAFWALEGGEVERAEDFVLLDIVGRRPDGSTVSTAWRPDMPGATSFEAFTGIVSMTFAMTTYWDAIGSLARGQDGSWYGCNGFAYRCGLVELDDLVLRFEESPVPVPLPAAGWVLAALLGGLGALRGTGRRSARR